MLSENVKNQDSNKTQGFTTASEAPMTRVSIDTLELPEDSEGFNGMVVIIDSFTRWVELAICLPWDWRCGGGASPDQLHSNIWATESIAIG